MLPGWRGFLLAALDQRSFWCLRSAPALIAAALTVDYRDIQHILPILIPFMLYASPVAYEVSQIPAAYQHALLSRESSRGAHRCVSRGRSSRAQRCRRRSTWPGPPRGRRRSSSWVPPSSGEPSGRWPMSSSELRDFGSRRRQAATPSATTAPRPRRSREAIVRRVRHPFARSEREQFWALSDVSFDVHRGEVAGADRQQRRRQEHAAEDSVAHHARCRKGKSISTAASAACSKSAPASTRS